jgi:hypothetical protein
VRRGKVPLYGAAQALLEAGARPEAKEASGARGVEVAARLAVGLARVPTDLVWRISQSQPTVEDGILLDALVDKRGRQGLTAGEEWQLAELVGRHDRVMVLRAEALALLHARGD